ncbi:MAG: fimbrillin family protein [Bacteroidaceae bacterium]|nr:fimbrillin family protein [Bacteroidaceae bacterium]
MKHIYSILTAAALLAACSNEDMLQTQSDAGFDGRNVLMQVDDYLFAGATRTTISNTGSFTWAKGDKVGVWPTLDPGEEEIASQVLFTAGAGGAGSATFTGSGWGLMPDRKYYAYFPYSASARPQLISCTWPSQFTQTANNSTAHLGASDFMYASATAPSEGNASFRFHHFGSLMKLVVTVPESSAGSRFTSAVIQAPSKLFPQNVSYNPVLDEPVLDVETCTDAITMNLGSIVPEDGRLTLWLMVGPADLSRVELEISLVDGKSILGGTFQGAEQRSGYGHEYAVSVEKTGVYGLVDMGLPSGTMWGISNLTMNGFVSRTGFGDFYTWGGLDVYYTTMSMKSDGTMSSGWKSGYSGGYSSSNYKKTFSTGHILTADEDAATQILGEGWSIPSQAQAKELYANCSYSEATVDGVKGATFTSKINGNSIFMPYNGYFSGTSFKGCSSNNPGARMWLNESTSSSKAMQFGYLSQGTHDAIEGKDCYRGTAIRPVYVAPSK